MPWRRSPVFTVFALPQCSRRASNNVHQHIACVPHSHDHVRMKENEAESFYTCIWIGLRYDRTTYTAYTHTPTLERPTILSLHTFDSHVDCSVSILWELVGWSNIALFALNKNSFTSIPTVWYIFENNFIHKPFVVRAFAPFIDHIKINSCIKIDCSANIEINWQWQCVENRMRTATWIYKVAVWWQIDQVLWLRTFCRRQPLTNRQPHRAPTICNILNVFRPWLTALAWSSRRKCRHHRQKMPIWTATMMTMQMDTVLTEATVRILYISN